MRLDRPLKDSCIVFEHKDTKLRITLKHIKEKVLLSAIEGSPEGSKISFFNYVTMKRFDYHPIDIPVSNDFDILLVEEDDLCL